MTKWSITSSALAPVPPEAIFPFYVDPSTRRVASMTSGARTSARALPRPDQRDWR